MYEMLAGKRPFEGDSAVTVLFRVVQQEAPSLRGTPGVPDDLADLVARLLAKDPALRPVADEVQTLLRCPPNAAELVAEAATGNLREQAVRDFVPEPVRRVSLDPPGSDAPGSLDISGPPAIEPGDPQSAPADSEGVTQDNRRSHPVGELGLSDATLTRIRRGISPEMAEARQREAVSLLLRGSLGEAVELLTMVAEVCRASFGPGHPTTLACHYWQGVCLARLGAGPEAVAKFADVTAGVTAVLTERD
jgi:serine/threonine protein kinase